MYCSVSSAVGESPTPEAGSDPARFSVEDGLTGREARREINGISHIRKRYLFGASAEY